MFLASLDENGFLIIANEKGETVSVPVNGDQFAELQALGMDEVSED